jgi:hypothetical protein
MSKSISNHTDGRYSGTSVDNGFGLFLHAAAVYGPHGAILLMGHSSSGKTTLSALLSDHFPVISDDLVFARPLPDGAWTVMNGTRIKTLAQEKGRVDEEILSHVEEKQYPLYAIIRIFAAQHTALTPLPPIKTCEYLMDAVLEVDIQRERFTPGLGRGWFCSTALIARRYPGRQLQFALEKSTVVPLLQKKVD